MTAAEACKPPANFVGAGKMVGWHDVVTGPDSGWTTTMNKRTILAGISLAAVLGGCAKPAPLGSDRPCYPSETVMECDARLNGRPSAAASSGALGRSTPPSVSGG